MTATPTARLEALHNAEATCRDLAELGGTS